MIVIIIGAIMILKKFLLLPITFIKHHPVKEPAKAPAKKGAINEIIKEFCTCTTQPKSKVPKIIPAINTGVKINPDISTINFLLLITTQ